MTRLAPGSRAVATVAALAAAALSGLAASPAAAQQTVSFPYVMRDNLGDTWDVQPDGQIGDGGNDLYDGASKLTVGGQPFAPQRTAMFDGKANEVTFAPQAFGPVRVARRVAVNAAASWCRYVEVVENPTARPARVSLRLNFDMGGVIQQSQQVTEDKKKTALGVAVWDGRRAFAMIAGGVGGKVGTRYVPQPNSDQCDLFVDVEVPPKSTAAVAHFQAMRPTQAEAVEFMTRATDKELLGDLPRDVRRAIVNFRRPGGGAGNDFELPRDELFDTVELRSGEQYRGTLVDAAFALDTARGPVALAADRVAGAVTVGTRRPAFLFATVDGEVVGGTLAAPPRPATGPGAPAGEADAAPPEAAAGGVRIRLSDGQVVSVPGVAIAKIGCRRRPGEADDAGERVPYRPTLALRDGQRLFVDPPADPVPVVTVYGDLRVPPESLAALVFQPEGQPVHQVMLRDGSRFAGVVATDALALRPRGATSTGEVGTPTSAFPTTSPTPSTRPTGIAVAFPLAGISRLQLVPPAEESPTGPSLSLANGDVMMGTLAGALELETAFDLIRAAGPDVRTVRPADEPEPGRPQSAELTLTLKDGSTVSGRLRGGMIDFALAGGGQLRVPAGLVDRYETPPPP
ncbi:MAG: hypothetical protein JWO31_2768, partial [Phycisphaerales bacterium]|nr:hypothetical protein [Phycisphaerales bacterium]